ncbi:hypothetical protein MIND_00945500 [Mycena indigotica]|uniref:Yeast cell wall synthesis Kre9/Knh1-like N-terminal domain-containing protein n=1 Tax=Mycena indigotica TaxID=2126181 RepID=A0A8H6SCQ0_9AGAR|nr:uncharacterized protein MIND_00945500 [Mycena indigotica]KAF7297126.1 hypothetical protein MIND_00945500 [Mycena indigotica]
MLFALTSILLALQLAPTCWAGLYFLQPASGSSCTGGSPCTVSWLDDGNRPLLPSIGVVTAGLYTGKMQLVQTLPPVDTSNVLSYQFTPIPEAGPNSNAYYIAFTSTETKVNGTNYVGFSPFFTLKGMSGSFSSPLASATRSVAIPTTISNRPGSIIPTTITVGNVDTSVSLSIPQPSVKPKPSSSFQSLTLPTTSFTSRFSTSSISSSPLPSVSPASAASTNFGARNPVPSLPFLAVLSLCILLRP